MFPYILLVFAPSTIAILSTMVKQRNTKINISDCGRAIMPLFFLGLLLLLVLRDETIGRDLQNYKFLFNTNAKLELAEIFSTWNESLWRLYMWFIYHYITADYQFFVAITAVLTILPIAWVYCMDNNHGFLKLVIFVNMSTFVMLFSGLRQSLAMAVGMLVYKAVKERKIRWFFFWSIVAVLIHHSGFMVIWMYPLYHVKMKRKHLLWIVPAMVVVYVFNAQIFSVLSLILSSINSGYEISIEGSTGAFGSLILFILFMVFSYVITDEKIMDAEAQGLRNFLIMTVVLQCFAPLHSLAMRMNYYYILFIPLALGKSLLHAKDKWKSIARIGEFIMCIFFAFMFVYTTYRAYIAGSGALETVPYAAFWQR